MGNDVLDIMEVDREPSVPQKTQTLPTASAKKEKKPEGVSRELFNLIGGAPAVVINKPTFKARPRLASKATHWVWRGFTSSAREDDLVLHHWVKASDEPHDYHFASFNQVVDVVEYTDTEYDLYLKSDEWSRSETDYLLDLCRRLDLRFIVIADRYDFEGTTRSIEDIKERYYMIQQKLLRARHQGGMHDQALQRELSLYEYNKDREIERKTYLEGLYQRTLDQIQEEEALFLEARRLEMNEKRLTQERQSILRLMNAHENNLALRNASLRSRRNTSLQIGVGKMDGSQSPDRGDSPQLVGQDGYLGDTLMTEVDSPSTPAMTYKNKKRKLLKRSGTTESGRGSLATSPALTNHGQLGTPRGTEIHDFDNGMGVAVTPLVTRLSSKDRHPPGAYLRSTRIAPVKLSMSQKVLAFLDELNVPPRPVMATGPICSEFDQLQANILTLLDLKKHVDKLEHDIKVSLARKAILLGQSPPNVHHTSKDEQ
ncbi:swr complex subunit [Dispira simplex]|nr:swr complex subunit [Dispira simplex]